MKNRSLALAGNATFTALSVPTGTHFTFKVKKGKKEGAPHFVSVLTGRDNEDDYQYLGTIFGSGDFRVTGGSRIAPDAPSAKAFEYVWKHIDAPNPAKLKILPSCACCRCGRKLTVPSSVEMGIGPECASKMEG